MSNTYDLEGRFAIVTGGNRGIGRAIVELFIASGARVAVWDEEGPGASDETHYRVDVTQSEQVASALARLPSGQRIDILVNNAGFLGSLSSFAAQADASWEHIIDVNLLGTMRVTRAVLPYMERQGFGRIVNLGSLAGKEGLPSLAAYSAASAGVIGFTKALSREVVAKNILINCVAPGPIETDMIRSLGAEVVERMVKDSPLGRLGRPAEVAELVAWLCSEAGGFNTGAVFDMSGGRARY